MGVQPSLFMLNTEVFSVYLTENGPLKSHDCARLAANTTLKKGACWAYFTGRSRACCDGCTPRCEHPLSIVRTQALQGILTKEQGLSKHMYLWAKIHWDGEFSWTREHEVDDEFWRCWALLTERTTHLTTDYDGRGLCGFLTVDELPGFVEQLAAIQRPDEGDGPDGLDMFESEDEFESLRDILEYCERCIANRLGLAWVHDFVN